MKAKQSEKEVTFSDILKYQRGLNKITRPDLAKKTGVSNDTIRNLERTGKDPSLKLLKAIAKAFQIPVDELLNCVPDNTVNFDELSALDESVEAKIKNLQEKYGGLMSINDVKWELGLKDNRTTLRWAEEVGLETTVVSCRYKFDTESFAIALATRTKPFSLQEYDAENAQQEE